MPVSQTLMRCRRPYQLHRYIVLSFFNLGVIAMIYLWLLSRSWLRTTHKLKLAEVLSSDQAAGSGPCVSKGHVNTVSDG